MQNGSVLSVSPCSKQCGQQTAWPSDRLRTCSSNHLEWHLFPIKLLLEDRCADKLFSCLSTLCNWQIFLAKVNTRRNAKCWNTYFLHHVWLFWMVVVLERTLHSPYRWIPALPGLKAGTACWAQNSSWTCIDQGSNFSSCFPLTCKVPF